MSLASELAFKYLLVRRFGMARLVRAYEADRNDPAHPWPAICCCAASQLLLSM